MTILFTLILLIVANGAPIITRNLFGHRGAFPVDCHLLFRDSRPLVGPSKTWRGVASSVIATAATAYLMGLSALTGAMVGLLAMLGDLTSSFIKRRLGFKPSSRAVGIDQLLESLLPTLALRHLYGFTLSEVGLIVVLFFAVELTVSWPLYKLKIRDRPY